MNEQNKTKQNKNKMMFKNWVKLTFFFLIFLFSSVRNVMFIKIS